ncbi:MAG: hypothetical protein C4318_02090 [Acidimicrobiia bacterium]
MANKAERLLNLLAILRETGRPLTAGEIRERVPGYPDSDTAFKRSFERDKAALREIGIEVESVAVPSAPEGVGYRANELRKRLEDPAFSPEEKAAMAVALGAISVLGGEDSDGNADLAHDLVYGAVKIGFHPEPEVAAEATAYLRVPAERLSTLVEAMLEERVVEFEYEKADGSVRKRKVEPHGIRCVKKNWYLAARELGDETLKAFRIDRIRSPIKKSSQQRLFKVQSTAEVDRVLRGAPWEIGGGKRRCAKVAVEASRASLAQRILGTEADSEDESGRHVFEVTYTNPEPLLEAVCGFREQAEILSPYELRSQMKDRLLASKARLEESSKNPAADKAVELAASVSAKIAASNAEGVRAGGSGSRSSKPREEAANRARRLVNIVPWLIRHPGASIDEVAGVFKVEKEALIKDLTMVTLTGIYPYLPHNLVDVSWSDGRVLVRSADYLESFANLTSEEAVVLYSALRAAARLPGLSDSAELHSGIEKLAKALGIEDSGMDILPERTAEEALELLRKAISGRETVDLEYVSYSSEIESRRKVDPLRLFVYEGRWYLEAYCHLSQEERIFRVSRITNAQLTGKQFKARGVSPLRGQKGFGESAGGRGPGDTGWKIEGINVEVVMAPEVSSWFTRAYPLEYSVQLDNGWSLVKFKASSRNWAIRVLFGIADRIVVLSPDYLRLELIESVNRALALYGASSR